MITKINREKLGSLLESFYNLTGIKTAVYDSNFTEVLAYPEKDSCFCRMIQENEQSSNECTKSNQRLCNKCAKLQKVIIEKCNAGLTEAIAPLTDGISTIGYIMFGQITNEENRDVLLSDVIKRCKEYGLSDLRLEKCLEQIRYYPDKQLEDASKILNAIAVYIVFDKLLYTSELSLAYKIAEYIKNNLENDLTVDALCKVFYLSKSAIYKITKSFMPYGIAAYVKQERLAKAEELLKYTKKSIYEIAELTGFSDANYFLRAFKKEKGMSAAKYRT